MALFTFNQADNTLLEDISATWEGDSSALDVQSSKLQATGGNVFAQRTAYLNEAGSTYAVAKFTAGSGNDYRIIICSSDGTIANGYYCKLSDTLGTIYRNGVYQDAFTLPGSVDVDVSNIEAKLEKDGTNIKLYAGPVGSTSLAGTVADASPISGGFSGFFFSGGGSTTPSVISFDNGVVSTPNPPTGVTASGITAFAATANWTDASSDETGFKVQYAPSPFSSWTAFSGSPAAANATTLATGNVLTDGTSYKFRVASTNAGGDSAWAESGVFTTSTLTRLRPNATTTAGSWTAVGAATLFGAMNEVTPSDAEYITTSSFTTGKFKIEVSTDPGDDNNHSVSIRARKTGGTLTVSLVQGDPGETVIKSWVVGATASFATYILTMTSGEASAITDYSNLYLKCVTT
jgi:hypothetical protein